MFEKEIDISAKIHPLLAKRWSGVSYDPRRAVKDQDIRSLAEAARWAPSCFGDQPWRYIIFNKYSNKAAWQEAYECLTDGNKSWALHSPLLIITCHDSLFSQNDKPNGWGAYDTGAASMGICLQAASMNLMTHQMAGFMPDKARESFSIPDRYTPIAMMTVGYQLPKQRIPEEFQARETAARARNPLDQHFFVNTWGEGISLAETQRKLK